MRFSDFVEINPSVRLNKGSMYPFVAMEVVTPGSRYIKTKTTREYTGGGSKFCSGDTLFARITPCLENGKIAQFINHESTEGFGSTEFFVFRARENVSIPPFVYYLVSTEIIRGPAEKSMTGASGRQRAELKAIENLEISSFSISTQQKIASILSAYDDLIENNLKRIKILEEMAQMIYREWFVNFLFPGHEKVKMVKSELGMIPEGWEIVKFKDLVDCIKDSTDAGEHLTDRLYVPIDCIPKRSLTLLAANPWEEAKSSLILFQKNDILFGAMRPYFHKVCIAPFDGITRTTCFVLRPKLPELCAYSTLTAFQDVTVGYANAHSQGATIPYAVWDGSLSELNVLLPVHNILEKFNEVITPLLQVFQTAYPKLQNLRKTRDILLPKLISGEIDTENVDFDIEAT